MSLTPEQRDEVRGIIAEFLTEVGRQRRMVQAQNAAHDESVPIEWAIHTLKEGPSDA